MNHLLQLSIKTILQNADRYKWSLRDFGMFRLYLAPRVRLHIWSPQKAWPGTDTVHAHPWDFKSTVVSGCVRNITYAVNTTTKPTHDYRRVPDESNGQAEGGAGLGVWSDRLYVAGDSYALRAEDVHESRLRPGTITIVDCQPPTDAEHTLVYYPHGRPRISTEPREARLTEVLDMAKAALYRLDVETSARQPRFEESRA